MKICLIKLGTDTIVDQDGNINSEVINQLKKVIIKLKSKNIYSLLVCSGAVSIGRKKLPNLKTQDINSLRIFASIGQPYLISQLQSLLNDQEYILSQILLTSNDLQINERKAILTHTIYEMLANNIIPVINENDLLSNEELEKIPIFNDNDSLAVHVGIMLSVTWLVILSAGIDGLYVNFENKELGIVKSVDDINSCLKLVNSNKSANGRGGMQSKLESLGLAMDHNITSYLINGFKIDNIIKGISGLEGFIGTKFCK